MLASEQQDDPHPSGNSPKPIPRQRKTLPVPRIPLPEKLPSTLPPQRARLLLNLPLPLRFALKWGVNLRLLIDYIAASIRHRSLHHARAQPQRQSHEQKASRLHPGTQLRSQPKFKV